MSSYRKGLRQSYNLKVNDTIDVRKEVQGKLFQKPEDWKLSDAAENLVTMLFVRDPISRFASAYGQKWYNKTDWDDVKR